MCTTEGHEGQERSITTKASDPRTTRPCHRWRRRRLRLVSGVVALVRCSHCVGQRRSETVARSRQKTAPGRFARGASRARPSPSAARWSGRVSADECGLLSSATAEVGRPRNVTVPIPHAQTRCRSLSMSDSPAVRGALEVSIADSWTGQTSRRRAVRTTLGLNGGWIFLASRSFQSIALAKKG